MFPRMSIQQFGEEVLKGTLSRGHGGSDTGNRVSSCFGSRPTTWRNLVETRSILGPFPTLLTQKRESNVKEPRLIKKFLFSSSAWATECGNPPVPPT